MTLILEQLGKGEKFMEFSDMSFLTYLLGEKYILVNCLELIQNYFYL